MQGLPASIRTLRAAYYRIEQDGTGDGGLYSLMRLARTPIPYFAYRAVSFLILYFIIKLGLLIIINPFVFFISESLFIVYKMLNG